MHKLSHIIIGDWTINVSIKLDKKKWVPLHSQLYCHSAKLQSERQLGQKDDGDMNIKIKTKKLKINGRQMTYYVPSFFKKKWVIITCKNWK